jgi:type IV pilus assembly protein PilE
MRNRSNGFTFVELLFTMTIAGVLASVAMPSYNDYMARGRITAAVAHLAVSQLQMQQYFQNSRSYVGAPACATDTTSSSHFDFSCPVQEDFHFVAQAIGKGPMAGFTLAVDDAGVARTVGVPTGWRMPSRNCWVLRRDGSC